MIYLFCFQELPPGTPTTEAEELEEEPQYTIYDSGSYNENEVDSSEFVVCDVPQPPQKRARFSEDLTTEESSMKTSDEFLNISNAMLELRRISEMIKEERNEFDIFGSFVAANLNKLPLVRALKLQEKINSLITAERINYATREEHNT